MNTVEWFKSQPIVGMVHLEPLPGSPGFGNRPEAEGLDRIIDRAVEDARRLESGGVDGLLIENFGDAPFYPTDVPKHTIASMTRVATAVRSEVSIPIGINVLRNDPIGAVSIAAATDATAVRVNVHTGAAVTDQGTIEGRAHETVRLREEIAPEVAVLADVDVKHAVPLGESRDLGAVTIETVERGRADGVICSGPGTGESIDLGELRSIREAFDDHGIEVPLFAGSGVSPATVAEVLEIADGAIVGTALKEDGEVTAPVDVDRVEELVDAADRAQ